jgi:hypothetical protein
LYVLSSEPDRALFIRDQDVYLCAFNCAANIGRDRCKRKSVMEPHSNR